MGPQMVGLMVAIRRWPLLAHVNILRQVYEIITKVTSESKGQFNQRFTRAFFVQKCFFAKSLLEKSTFVQKRGA